MVKSPAQKHSAIETAYTPGRHGNPAESEPGIVFVERRNLSIAHIADNSGNQAIAQVVQKETGCALPAKANTATTNGACSVLSLAPARWLVVSAGHDDGALAGALRNSGTVVNDIGGGRTVIRLSGWRVRDLLAKGCPVDIHPCVFGPGACAATDLLHIPAIIHNLDDYSYDVYVSRSYALSLWDWLTDGAEEFGYQVDKVGA